MAAGLTRRFAGAVAVVGATLALGLAPVASAMTLGQSADFAIPTAGSAAQGSLVAGPDGNLWFAEFGKGKIGEINPTTHAISEFATPTVNSGPLGLAVGPNGNIWFTEWAVGQIGEINPTTHSFAEFSTPGGTGSFPVDITAGPDGNMWFTESGTSEIGEINPNTGLSSQYPTPDASSLPFGITAGPDGNIWFTEKAAAVNKIASINPTTHATVSYPTTGTSAPNAITTGPDGSLWFTESGTSKIGLFNVTSKTLVAEIPTPTASSSPLVIVPGPDGNLWFTESSTTVSQIAELNPVTHQITEFPTPTAAAGPVGIATGPDGNLWFTEATANKIGVIGTGEPGAAVTAPTISGNPTPGSLLSCQAGAWTTWAGLQPSLSTYGFDGYLWLANGTPVSKSQTYIPTGANVGQQLTCQTTATYSLLLTTVIATSAAVTVGSPPVATALPGITGTAVAGQTVTEVHGGWANTPTTFAYQWQLCNSAGAGCVSIAGATGQTYAIPSADAGLSLQVVETTANQYGTSGPAVSSHVPIAALPSPQIAKVTFTGTTASVSVDCAGAADQTCAGSYSVTSEEHLKGKTIVAVTASTSTKETTKTVTIASGSYSVPSATTTAISVPLNTTGKKLLAQFYKVAGSLKVTGTTTVTKSVTFSYTVIKSPVSFTWDFSPSFTVAEQLTVSSIPSKGSVEAICHGKGCPFGTKRFTPKHGSVNVASALGKSHLSPNTTLELEVTAPNDVGKVVEFKVASGKQPTVTSLCLAPGAKSPAKCA